MQVAPQMGAIQGGLTEAFMVTVVGILLLMSTG